MTRRRFSGDTLLVATHNQGKLEEMRHLLEPFGIRVTGAADHALPEPEETEETFVGNARIKAHAAARATGLPTLSDDSGIEIDALGGAPGVHTADWAETPTGRDFVMAMERAHRELEAVNAPHPRTARFCCTLVLAWPDGHDEVFPGVMPGHVVWPMRGDQGHGYDPIFVPEGHDVTFAEMDRWEKNKISHRARAVAQLIEGCLAEDWTNGGFGLYVHWPFCQAKCPYCDFNSHVSREIDESVWVRAYVSEIERVAADTQDRVLSTIFFGGGTPSLMHPDTVARLIEAARRHWPCVNDMEITLEANPGSVEADRFAGYRQAGVNRVSMGIQALNDADLRRLGRLHSVDEALAAFDIARNCFDRVSFDLIYARQDQSLRDWEAELSRALSLAIDHLSLYQLTIEDGTAFGDRFSAGGLRGLPDDDLGADMYHLTQDLCEGAGMPGYEVSNHAAPGAESRHNLVYWRYGDYAGIGPGAHGRLTLDGARYATESHSMPGRWLAAVNERADGESGRESLSREEQSQEMLMMGLRLRDGVDLDRFAALAGTPLSKTRIDQLQELGMVSVTDGRLSATARGRAVLNAVLRELVLK